MKTINVENQKMELPFDENEQANVILGTDTFPLRAIRFHSQPTISQGSMSRRWKWKLFAMRYICPWRLLFQKQEIYCQTFPKTIILYVILLGKCAKSWWRSVCMRNIPCVMRLQKFL